MGRGMTNGTNHYCGELKYIRERREQARRKLKGEEGRGRRIVETKKWEEQRDMEWLGG